MSGIYEKKMISINNITIFQLQWVDGFEHQWLLTSKKYKLTGSSLPSLSTLFIPSNLALKQSLQAKQLSTMAMEAGREGMLHWTRGDELPCHQAMKPKWNKERIYTERKHRAGSRSRVGTVSRWEREWDGQLSK